MDSEKQTQEQVKIAIEKQQQSPSSQLNSEKAKKLPLKYYILIGVGAFTLLIFSLIMAGVLNTALCGGKNRNLFNSCQCNENYRQFKNQGNCVGPFSDIFTDEDIEISLINQEDNIVNRAYKRNLMENFQYNLKHLQSFKDQNGTESHAETNIQYNINVLTKEVSEDIVETYFIVENSTVTNDQGYELYSEGYPKIIHEDQQQQSSKSSKDQQDGENELNEWEKYHAEQLGISEQRYQTSRLPIIKVIFYKDRTIESIHYPVNLDKNYKQLFDNILDQYSLPLNQKYYDQNQNQYSYSPESNEITKQNTQKDRSDNTTFVDSDQKMTQTQQIENGQLKQSTLEAQTEILQKADETTGSEPLFSNMNFKQIVHFLSKGSQIVEQNFVENLLQVLETNFLHQVSQSEFDDLIEQENKFYEQKNLSESTIQDQNSHRNLLAANLIPLQQFTLFNFNQIGIVIQGYSQFYCNQGSSVDGRDDCYINLVFRFMDSWYTEQSHFKAEVQTQTELKFSTLYNQYLVNKNYGKSKRYNTVANIGMNLGATLTVQAHLKVDYFIQSNGVLRFIATFRITAKCTGSVNVAAVAARAGAYIDATLYDATLTMDLGASYLGNNFNGRTKMHASVLEYSAHAGAYYQLWECHMRRECKTIVVQICVDVPKCNWGSRKHIYNPLNSNYPPTNYYLPTVTIGNGIVETEVQLPGQDIRHVSWQRVDGILKQCSIDSTGKVWGVEPTLGYIYMKNHILSGGWINIGGQLKQVSVAGNHVWGVNNHDDIFYYTAHGWQHIPGKLSNIDVQQDGRVWGVNSADYIYTRWQSTGQWQNIGGNLKNIAVASDKVVGTTYADNAFQKSGVYGPWVIQPGIKLNQITISENGRRWGVTDNFEIYNSPGENYPWTKVNGGLKYISASGNHLCGIGSDNSIWYAQI